MATLLASTVNGTLTASTSITSPKLLQTYSTQQFKEYVGSASIPSSVNSATNYVDLFANIGSYERMLGYVSWTVYQSQIHTGSFIFQLSEYGLSASTLVSGANWSVARHSPTFGTNYIRFTSTVGKEWGNGTYYFVVRVTGLGGHNFTSSYLTERIR
jgi:hypothetical protein